tara:strand:+ start:388 stop:1236 length:849 start_codon:yes stop_codon:yes gene_type:complete
MKLVNFCAYIDKGSDQLICQSDKNFLSIDESFSVRIEDESYEIREVKKEEAWYSFKNIKNQGKQYLSISGAPANKLFPKDFAEIYLSQYSVREFGMIVENGEGYQENEVIVFEDFGGKCNLRIDGVNESGGVTSLHIDHIEDFYISGHREIEFSSIKGKGCKIVIELADTKKKKVLPKNIKTCFFSRGVYYIDFEYEIPEYIEGGQIKIYRSTCTLDKKNLQDLEGQIVCIAQKVNYTPKMQIPIVQKGTINAYKMYNEGATIIEDKFMELEKRIIELESRI